MKKAIKIIVPLALCAFISQFTANAGEPLKVLMVAGGCCHDYPNQKTILGDGIKARANVEFTFYVEEDTRDHKNSAYAKEDWSKTYDVVIHNECYGGVKEDAFIEKITKAHKDGLAGISLHCSSHSYRNAKTDEWRKVMGVSSYNHGPKAGIQVTVKRKDHPIMVGLKDFKTKEGELYNVKEVWDTATVLADGTRGEGEKAVTQPLMWINEYGKGKWFGTTLGHHNSTMSMPEYLDIAARGLLWACGKLNADGTPLEGYGPTGK